MTEGTKLCVCLAEPTVAACQAALATLPGGCAEIRLDAMSPAPAELRELFAGDHELCATCRSGPHDDVRRGQLLLAAVEAGAAYVDIELEAPFFLRRELLRASRAHGCQLIVSVHHLDRTPPPGELDAIVDRCFDVGADLAKIACWVHSDRDAARLLGLLDDARPLIVVGLGPRGRLVRIAAPLLGSRLAYASAGPDRATGPGQLDAETLGRWLEELGGA